MTLTSRLEKNFSEEKKYTPKSIREMLSKKGVPFDEWVKTQKKDADPKILKIAEEISEKYLRENYPWMLEAKEKFNKKKEETEKKGVLTRFQLINDATIEETDEFGHTRQFHLNKEKGTWEAKTNGYPEKAELTIVGKNLFSVKEFYQGSYETILYSPARKVQEMFVLGKSGKYFLHERTDEDLNGMRDRQLFDEKGQMIEQRISDKGALKKLVRDGKVLFDKTKSVQQKLNNAIKINNGLKR